MTYQNSQLFDFLLKAFEFLCSQEFSLKSEDWKIYCNKQGISLEDLKKAKAELLLQSRNINDDTERLQQIFCCDPFDAGNVKALRDNWYKKVESQPDPYQEWITNISIHLLDLDSAASPTFRVDKKPTTSPLLLSKISKEVLFAIITGNIIGIFVMAALIINNLNKPLLNSQTNPINTSDGEKSINKFSMNSSNIKQETKDQSLERSNFHNTQDSTLPKINDSEAFTIVENLYNFLSNKQFDQALSLCSSNLQKQFNSNFFEKFSRVTVEDLQITSQTDTAINLIGINTYVYPDGSTQREKRSYTVRFLNGDIKITSSEFIKVIKPRK